MDFGRALEALKTGLIARRKGWGSTYIKLQPGKSALIGVLEQRHISTDSFQMLGVSAKLYEHSDNEEKDPVIVMHHDGKTKKWKFSFRDLLAEDWQTY